MKIQNQNRLVQEINENEMTNSSNIFLKKEQNDRILKPNAVQLHSRLTVRKGIFMVLDFRTRWASFKQGCKAWWAGERCFIKNPLFWLLTGGTVAAVLLTAGFLFPLLALIPVFAITAQKGWLTTSLFFPKKYTLVEQTNPSETSLEGENTMITANDLPPPPNAYDENAQYLASNSSITNEESLNMVETRQDAELFHTQLFKEGLLLLEWVYAPFSALLREETEQEKKDLAHFFRTPLEQVNASVPLSDENQIFLEQNLMAYEQERQQATDAGQGLVVKFNKEIVKREEFQPKIHEKKFVFRLLAPFSSNSAIQNTHPIPTQIHVFEKNVPAEKIRVLYSLVVRVFQKIASFPANHISLDWNYRTITKNEILVLEAKAEFDAWCKNKDDEIAKIKAETAEYEKNILIANAKAAEAKTQAEEAKVQAAEAKAQAAKSIASSFQSKENIKQLKEQYLQGLKTKVKTAYQNNNFDFLRRRIEAGGYSLEEITTLIDRNELSPSEIKALHDEALIPKSLFLSALANKKNIRRIQSSPTLFHTDLGQNTEKITAKILTVTPEMERSNSF